MLPVPPILMHWLAPPFSPNRPGSASWWLAPFWLPAGAA